MGVVLRGGSILYLRPAVSATFLKASTETYRNIQLKSSNNIIL